MQYINIFCISARMFGHFNFLEVINLEALIKRAGYRRSGRFKHTDGFRWKLPFSSKSDRRLSAYCRRSLSDGSAAIAVG